MPRRRSRARISSQRLAATKKPGLAARALAVERTCLAASRETHPTFLKALPKLSFTGSIDSVAAFCAIATSSLD